MKKTIYLITLLLIISSAYAIYSGESYNVYSGECNYLDVNININPYQNESEYTFNQECEFIELGHYKCNCVDNYLSLNIIPKINSVGNYTITTNIYKLIEEEVKSSGGGGGAADIC